MENQLPKALENNMENEFREIRDLGIPISGWYSLGFRL